MVQVSTKPSLSFLQEDSIAAYLKSVGRTKLLKPEEERLLLTKAKLGDRKSLNALVEANLRFVISVCLQFRGRGIPLGDLVNEGNLGLIKAVEKFEPAVGVKFLSYAVWWIRQGVYLALARQAGFMSAPPHWIVERSKIRKAEQKLTQKLGRPPFLEELQDETGRPRTEIEGYLVTQPHAANPLVSEKNGEVDILDLIPNPDPDSNPEAEAERHLSHKFLEVALKGLGKREEFAIRHFYGLGTDAPWTLEEIACALGLSRERIRQIKDSGLSKLRRPVPGWNA